MNSLKFCAREDLLVREAGLVPRVGAAARYYGRAFDPELRGHPATPEPATFDAGSDDAKKCVKQCRKGALWAADKATAAVCGVPFVDIEFVDGAWVAKRSKPVAEKAAKAEKVS